MALFGKDRNRRNRQPRRLRVEPLERRELLSIDLTNGVLSIIGTDAPETAVVSQVGSVIRATLSGGPAKEFSASSVSSIYFEAKGGNDLFYNNTGLASKALGGAGNDRFYGGSGNDRFYGGAGSDRLYGGAGADKLYGEAGDDYLWGRAGSDWLYGGAGADYLYGEQDADTLSGGAGNDRLDGGEGNDVLNGGAGIDVLYGRADNDELHGGTGTDNLFGGAGNDLMFGEVDLDYMYGGDGDDTLYGGDGADFLYGQNDNDTLYGYDPSEMTSDSSDDEILGGAGNDVLYGGLGNDSLYGEAGNDHLYAGMGGDGLFGGSGNDVLMAIEDDTCDHLWGGDGTDIFWFDTTTDTVHDADAWEQVQHEYINDYPRDFEAGWTEDMQGVAHDDSNWFFTQQTKLWKFPVGFDLNTDIAGPPPGGLRASMPYLLAQDSYNHFGDVVCYRGLVLVPTEGGPFPIVAIFKAADLEYAGYLRLTAQASAPWCAVNPVDGCLYSSNTEIDQSQNQKIYKYSVNWDLVCHGAEFGLLAKSPGTTNPIFAPLVNLPCLEELTPRDGSGNVLNLRSVQGGEFTEEGRLYLSNGYIGLDESTAGCGIHAFEFNGTDWLQTAQSTDGYGSFNYAYHPKWGEEPEGLTVWNVDNLGAPGIQGQLHVLLLDNDYWDMDFDCEDEVLFKHYRIPMNSASQRSSAAESTVCPSESRLVLQYLYATDTVGRKRVLGPQATSPLAAALASAVD